MNRRYLQTGVVFAGLALMALTITALPSAARQQDPSQESTGDPVADAARKARERKKKESSKPKKVYTDEDVNHLIPESAPAVGDGNTAANEEGGTKKPDAQGKDANGKDAGGKTADSKEDAETMWRKQFKDAYANLYRAEKELDILQREDNKAQVQYYSDPQKALAEQYTRQEIVDKDAKIAAKKKEVEEIKQRISDMEESLRKAGGDPGWATP